MITNVLPKTVVTLTDEYITARTTAFMKTFDNTNGVDYNSGVDAVFYSKKDLAELLADENNTLEKTWRSKMLFENTPRGNIIMYYDAFKQGFRYYSDQNSLPYSLVNAVAMKYVIIFRCRDFFMDETVLPEDNPSGIIREHEAQNKTDKDKSENSKKESNVSSTNTSAAFAKFKSYNTVSAKATGNVMKSSEKRADNVRKEETAAPKRTNSLVSMGKMTNLSFIQKEITKTPEFESMLLPKKRLSYADYKRMATAR